MRAALVVFGATCAAALLAAYLGYRYLIGFPDRPVERPGRPVALTIPRGATFPTVVGLLEAQGLVRNGLAFRLYANYRRLESKIRHGSYSFRTSITPRELLDKLVEGVPAPTVKVTVPEGKNMIEIAELLAARGVSTTSAMLQAMRDKPTLRRVGVPGDSAEGFLFPDTYRFSAETPAAEVLRLMFKRHMQVFVQLRGLYPKRMHWFRRRLGWDHHEIVTLASIVEKETGQGAERPLIAGVFLNRLLFDSFGSKLLQTDPTIIYGCTVPRVRSRACQTFEGRIRRIHLDDSDNPYNTYTHPGLPPGPIANPGEAALRAVFEPTRSRYLYFVSRNDGTHVFSQSVAEHERAVDRYQRSAATAAP